MRRANEEVFLRWARERLTRLPAIDPALPIESLTPLGEMIGDATVVALTEAVHCAAEPLEFRNRLFRYLVEEKGFTAIAIESGLAESRLVHHYVREGTGCLDTVLVRGVSWTFDRLPQNRALIEWMRAYNKNHTRPVSFYGFDVPGSPGNPQARRGVDTALNEALSYLQRVDSEAAGRFRALFAPFMAQLHFDLVRPAHRPGYDQLGQAERDTLTAAIADLITLLECKKAQYTAASTAVDYAWGYRCAVGARQVDTWLRQIPLGWRTLGELPQRFSDEIAFLKRADDVRDRAQADNLEWILEREGPSAKVLVYAARVHLSTAPVKASFWRDETEHEGHPAGTYLKRRLGRKLVTVGNLIGQGKEGCGEYWRRPERALPSSIDGLAAEAGTGPYLLDLRTAPDSLKRWLDKEHSLVVTGSQVIKLSLGRAFDILFYIDAVSPAGV